MNKHFLTLLFVINTLISFSQESQLHIDSIRIRDPYILADNQTGNYYMYASCANRLDSSFNDKYTSIVGVEAYTSKDLIHWELPNVVLNIPDPYWANELVWAPEVHKYEDKYYLFVTLTSTDLIKTSNKKKSTNEVNKNHVKRGTQIFVSDSPLGPFMPFADAPHTPKDWMALDGTLHVEDGSPYMIFCHEWVQISDGSIDYIKLKRDLSKSVGKPIKMFNASEAEWSTNKNNKVTDGCFIYKTKKDKLLMIWSSFGKNGYAIGIAESSNGKIDGDWIQQEKLLFKQNGGHGMIFKTFDGRLMLTLHQPNSPAGKERMKLFELEDKGDTIAIKEI